MVEYFYGEMRVKLFSLSRLSLTALLTAAGCLSSAVVAAEERQTVLEEVVVTATKREASLQDVPISVGVVTGEFIDTFDIRDMSDVQNFVPGLQVQQTFGSWAVRIRGLGSGITNLAFDSSVPVYIDDVYCGRGKCLESAFLDMERIEVARGPQGALFGKSTIAGAINTVSQRPTQEFEAQIKMGAEVENGHVVAEKLARLHENLTACLTSFQDILPLRVDDEKYPQIDPGVKKVMVFESLRDLFVRES